MSDDLEANPRRKNLHATQLYYHTASSPLGSKDGSKDSYQNAACYTQRSS